jgi:acyl-[acyl-carrier-protein]-phospholipid O-acyltransferase/long-chain-fatty-acid--[acyl-carrier-protein] ligase
MNFPDLFLIGVLAAMFGIGSAAIWACMRTRATFPNDGAHPSTRRTGEADAAPSALPQGVQRNAVAAGSLPRPPRRRLAEVLTACARPWVRALYRLDLCGLDNVPRTGGVILAANHVSYVDVVLLCAISPRPLRIVAWGGFQRNPVFRVLFRIFGCLPVTPANARASLREAVRALADGDAVLIFPEGHITRTGEMNGLEGGFQLLARRAGVPVVPVRLIGLWGSIFSHERGRFFWKRPRRIPYPVTIRFGTPLAPVEATTDNLRHVLLALAAPSPVTSSAPRTFDTPLLDFGEAAFRNRPELAGHLGHALVGALARQGSREIIVDRTGARRTLDSAKLLAVSLALAARLRRPEPRVGIVLPPGLGGIIANLAVVFAGKTPVNLNFTIGRAALETAIRRAGVRTTLSADAFREKLAARLPDLPWSEQVLDLPKVIAALPRAGLAARLLGARLLPAGLFARLCGVPRQGGDREAALLFTSGSAGEPKGVILTHRNILGNCAQIDACGILPQGETLLANLPIFHSFGFTITIWYALLRGVRLVTVPSPLDVRACAEAISAEKVTVLLGTPTFFRPYLKRVEPAELASVKCAIGGAEKTPAGFHEAWEARFGGRYFEGYGLTETSPVVAVNLPAQSGLAGGALLDSRVPGQRAGSVGRLLDGQAVRIVDPETGAPRGFQETGLLLLRGVNIFAGYLDQPEATAAALKDGWLITGDLARLDPDGFLYIEGRLSRFSKIGGEMVPHGTIEAAIAQAYTVPGADAPAVAVTARPDPAKGEALVLVTTLDIQPDDLRDKLAAAGFANLWVPRIVKRVDALPTLASGKLDLRRLREIAGGE